MNTHVVLRPFEGKRLYQPGEEVDASGWRTVRLLEERRYIKPLLPSVIMDEAIRRSPGRPRRPRKEVQDGSQSTQ